MRWSEKWGAGAGNSIDPITNLDTGSACVARHIFPISEIIVKELSADDSGFKYILTTPVKLGNIKCG